MNNEYENITIKLNDFIDLKSFQTIQITKLI